MSSSTNNFITQVNHAVADASDNDCDSAKEVYNKYVSDSMLPENKTACWYVTYKDNSVPIVAVALDNEYVNTIRKACKKIGKQQFNCMQCAENCRKLVTIFGKDDYMLCRFSRLTTQYTTELSDNAQQLYNYAGSNANRFTLTIATDKLLLKDKHDYVNPRHPPTDSSRTFLHYAGNCDTLDSDVVLESKDLTMLNSSLDKYWILMYNLLGRLTIDWHNAGQRHATLQRIRTIQELSREVTYAEAHFAKTLSWILNILGSMTKPLNMYKMSKSIQLIADAIANGHFNYDGNGKNSVVHFQYAQMNNTIMMWMTKAMSRSALKKMMTALCGPSKGQRTKELSTQQIQRAEVAIGDDFWTRVATTKTLEHYYGNTPARKFWTAPSIQSSQESNAKAGFAALKAGAKNKKSYSGVVCKWDETNLNVESIPELIELLESGINIHIKCNDSEHAVLAHTNIDPKHLLYKPVEDKGALLWCFLGGRGFGVHKTSQPTWNRLIAIHYLEAGAYSNYILVTDTSRSLPQSLHNNPVMGEWTLSSSAQRHMGPVFSKLKVNTHLSKNTEIGYTANSEYPIIGVGVCSGPNGTLSYGSTLQYRASTDGKQTEHTIKYFNNKRVYYKKTTNRASLSQMGAKFCSNCGAPRGNKNNNFCGNCGRSF